MRFRNLSFAATLIGATVICAVPSFDRSSDLASRALPNTPNFTIPEARAAVLEAFQHSWKGYVDNAFGADEVNPIDGSKSFSRYVWHLI